MGTYQFLIIEFDNACSAGQREAVAATFDVPDGQSNIRSLGMMTPLFGETENASDAKSIIIRFRSPVEALSLVEQLARATLAARVSGSIEDESTPVREEVNRSTQILERLDAVPTAKIMITPLNIGPAF